MASKTAEEKAEMYRRQLGGTNAALNRSRQREAQLESALIDAFQAIQMAADAPHLAPTIKSGLAKRLHALGLLKGVK